MLPHSSNRLRRNALGLPEIVASTLANIAPAMSFYFGFATIVQGAGVAAPLTIAVAMVAILFLANTVAEFSRFHPSAGSFVTFIGRAFGPSAAAATSIFVVVGYVIAASAVVVISGGWAHDTLKTFLGISVPWQIISAAVAIIVGVLVSRGISLSTRWAGIFFIFELVLLLVGAVAMLMSHHGSISLASLNPANLSGGLKGIGLGFPLAIYLFIGWENSATLAEETENPRRNVPRALLLGTLAIGVLYIFLAVATENGFGNDAKAVGAATIPYVDALKASAAGLLFVAYLAGLTSIFSSLIGLTNSQARILFNSGREGLLPAFFGKIHPEHGTPHVSLWAFIGVALTIVLVFGRHIAPVDLFGDVGTLGTIPVIVTYLVTNLALPVYVLKHARGEFGVVRHLILPLLGAVMLVLPLWGLIEPGHPAPFNLFPYAAGALLFCSALYGVLLAWRSPELMARIGSYVADAD